MDLERSSEQIPSGRGVGQRPPERLPITLRSSRRAETIRKKARESHATRLARLVAWKDFYPLDLDPRSDQVRGLEAEETRDTLQLELELGSLRPGTVDRPDPALQAYARAVELELLLVAASSCSSASIAGVRALTGRDSSIRSNSPPKAAATNKVTSAPDPAPNKKDFAMNVSCSMPVDDATGETVSVPRLGHKAAWRVPVDGAVDGRSCPEPGVPWLSGVC